MLGPLMSAHGGLLLTIGANLLNLYIMPQENGGGSPAASFPLPIRIGPGTLGISVLIIGLMNVASGFMAARFRCRTFIIISLTAALPTMITCCCLPTSVTLFIWGMIVLRDPSVKLAFRYADQGYTAQEVRKAFARLPQKK